MKNLKKVLALVLVVASVLSFATVASAASFTDKDSITNTEAVNMLADLGVINGFTDGSYRPTETVTRAQMAKMIYAVCTGDDDASGFVGTTTALTDLNQAPWAEGYIKYCYSLGIINGFTDNTFRPNEPVTVAQAAKMLLVALGYDSNEYVGASWSINTMRDAKAAKITKDVSASATLAASRDVSAQLIYNTMFADQVTPEYQYDMGVKYVTGYKKTGTTLAEDSFDMVKVSGQITAVNKDSVVISGTKIVDGKETPSEKEVKLTGDYDMLGKTGTVYYKNDNGKETLYSTSIAVDDGLVLHTTTNGDSVYKTAVKTGRKVSLNDEVTIYQNGTATEKVKAETFTDEAENGAVITMNGKGTEVLYIDSDKDGKADVIKVTKMVPVKVSTYNTINKKLTISNQGQGITFTKTTFDFEDVNDIDSFAKGDIAMGIEFPEGKLNLYPTTVVEGTISGTVASSKSARIDGTVYGFSAAAKDENNYTDVDAGPGKNVTRGAEGKFYLDANGYIVYADTTSTTSVDKLAYVKKAGGISYDDTQKATLVFTDGTEAVVDVSKVSQTETGNATDVKDGNVVAKGDVVTYSVSDGKYTLKKVELASAKEVAIKKGTPQNNLVDGKQAITTATTLYVDVENKAVYTGYANVPDQKAANLAGAKVKLSSDESKVELVFLVKADTTSSNTKFFVYNKNGYETGMKGDTEIRTYNVIIDGELTTLDVEETVGETITKAGYYEGTVNSKGNLTEIAEGFPKEGVDIAEDNSNLGGDKSSVLIVGNSSYVVNEDTIYYQIKDNKANVADISLVDDTDVAKVYVQVVGTKTEADEITAAIVYFMY